MTRLPDQDPQPFSDEEIAALRQWHRRRRYSKTPECLQGDPWPCRTARFLATLDAMKPSKLLPKEIARFYNEWNDRLEVEHPTGSGWSRSEEKEP
jgi:hypothetical protein